MRDLTLETKEEIRGLIYQFFADECESDIAQLTAHTNISTDLDGDSLLFVEFVELMKKKYGLEVQLQSLGKHLLKHPAETIGQFIEVAYRIYQYENEIVNLESMAN